MNFIFKTVPNWIENVPYFRLRGKCEFKTQLYKSFPSLVGTNEGIFRIRTDGVDISDLSMIGMAPSQVAGVGTGCLICYAATAGGPVGYGHMERLNLTSGAPGGQAYIFTNVFLDGSANAGGVRAIAMNDVKLFGAEAAALYMTNVVAFTAKGPGTFTAGGKTGKIFIDGSAGHVSSYVDIDFARISDGLQTSQIQGGLIKAGSWGEGQIVHDAANSSGVITSGILQNCTLGTMGINCFHLGGTIDNGAPPAFVKGAAVPIDSGTNGTGYWRKYGDKTIEQSMFVSGLVSGVAQAFNFPISFASTTFTSIAVTPDNAAAVAISVTAHTATNVTLIANANTNAWVSVRGL